MSNDAVRPPSRARRWLPAVVLLAGAVAVYLTGLHRYITFLAFVENSAAIEGFVATRLFAAVAAFMAVYVAVVALSLPGAAVMSIIGGFLFGWPISVPATIAAATAGSVIVFHAVKTSLGAALAERSGPLVRKLSDGFAHDAFNYLLFLRLLPVFPFFAVNAVAGLCRVPLKTFVAATALGIIPGSLAFAYLGTGLGKVISAQKSAYDICAARDGVANCSISLDLSQLLTREIVIALSVLGLVALLPIAIKFWKKKTP